MVSDLTTLIIASRCDVEMFEALNDVLVPLLSCEGAMAFHWVVADGAVPAGASGPTRAL
ncbi:hypothetical protein [Thiocapsa marina]|uniref:hypothetical protein n=1 Tax=Thiocapsa marina TaxID=244573 RepID=UPI00031830E8|nr:hypothetical protein [Thiocapsa marina]